ncbi:MAG: type IV pilus biogenesis/stability protein PilW, partial [Pseudomonadota bacterium]|nr:type IV pilus biogenesis/stability protein PilW [Pseudomonadota bacterium]
ALYHMADTHYQLGEFKLALDYLKRYEAVAQHSPQTLWLGIQIQRALEQTAEEAKYAMLLRSQYPDSEEAYRLRQLEKPR